MRPWILLFLLLASQAHAGNGVLEINEACAAVGCFAGDPPGLPVVISQPGSYRLTGALNAAAANDTAISITTAAPVTLHLSGFALSGPVSCTGAGSSLSCSPSGTGIGIAGGNNVWVRDGRVAGFAGGGVALGGDARVEGVQVLNNGAAGISVGVRARVSDCNAVENAGDGIETATNALVVRSAAHRNLDDGIDPGTSSRVFENGANGNGDFGIEAAADSRVSNNTLVSNETGDLGRAENVSEPHGNTCSDDGCSRQGLRLYYLHTPLVSGDQALTACATGFHMANLFELLDPSNLQFDHSRRIKGGGADTGTGPPSEAPSPGFIGWIRTGYASVGGETTAGEANCLQWTSSSEQGTVMSLQEDWNTGPDHRWPWNDPLVFACEVSAAVWCIQD